MIMIMKKHLTHWIKVYWEGNYDGIVNKRIKMSTVWMFFRWCSFSMDGDRHFASFPFTILIPAGNNSVLWHSMKEHSDQFNTHICSVDSKTKSCSTYYRIFLYSILFQFGIDRIDFDYIDFTTNATSFSSSRDFFLINYTLVSSRIIDRIFP